ncbi:hypothetical protein YYC_03477 [Plasmodium yoelii 17X]|uniref:Gamma tubulin complex component protein N-terminal domain-containing protein n=1 Tax=Plasmodium yoelii 17X TaxID=1323249 RepID=V7PI55_PLAYE|nr:hypothetical protein YYC_03477 [Plasmodium yoelii 17X]
MINIDMQIIQNEKNNNIEEQQNRYLNNEIKSGNYCDISLLRLIDEWSDIEANLYPIKNNKILKKIKYEIKKFIYSNILHKIKVNFTLFNIYYNYKYSYHLSYVNNQYFFDIFSNSCDYFYEILKKYHQENEQQFYDEFLEEKHGKEFEKKYENDLNCSENACTVHKDYNKYMDEIFYQDENDSSGNGNGNGNGNNNEENCLILTQLYTSIIYCFILLIKNKYYLDFICLYMYIKFYFSINKLFLKRNICLNFTCHKTFLNLLFLLSDISIYNNNFDYDDNNGRKENNWEKKYTNKLRDLYNFDKFDQNINIGNLTNLSFNLILNLKVKINFYETNYDIDQNKYKHICKYLLFFQNELIQKYVLRLNELTNLTLKYKQYIFNKKQTTYSECQNLSTSPDSYVKNTLTDYLSRHYSEQTKQNNYDHGHNYNHNYDHNYNDNDNDIDGFSSFRFNNIDPYCIDGNFSNQNSLLKNYIFQKNITMNNLKSCNGPLLNSSLFDRPLFDKSLVAQFDSHKNGQNKYLENEFLFICLNNKTYKIRIEKLIPNFFHKKNILNLDSEHNIYTNKTETDLLIFFKSQNYKKNTILKKYNHSIINYFNKTSHNYVDENKNEQFDNDECNTFLWKKSYANDTLTLKMLERKIIIEKNEIYKNNYLNIINSIYVTLHKNIICSVNHRIEEYRYIFFKKFLIFFINNSQKNKTTIKEKNDNWKNDNWENDNWKNDNWKNDNWKNDNWENDNWKNDILECLVGYENEMFITSRRHKKIIESNKNYSEFCEKKMKKIKNGSIYINKNIICVDYNIAFWGKKKNKKYFRLYFNPFQNIFSSAFYQKYFHIFLYFSKIGSLVRYIKTFVHVFLKLIYKKEEDYLTECPRENIANIANIANNESSHVDEIIPFGDVFMSFINSINKYILKYEQDIRKIILYADLKTPLEIYNKIKQYTECIIFLNILCSCYIYKLDIFSKKNFPFSQIANVTKKNEAKKNEKLATEYNYVSNVIYGLAHKTNFANDDGNENHLSRQGFRQNSNCLFIFPRGNELINYIYSYYYLFINVNNKNLKNLCKYIFLRIIKPFLYFLYSYVFMGINTDYYHEYILNKNINMLFFYIYTNHKIIYNKHNLNSNQALSLPVFLNYAIKIVYSTASLSKFLRRSSENDFYLSFPKFPTNKPHQRDKQDKRGKRDKRENKNPEFCIKNETEIAKFLCSASINKIKSFLNCYDKYKKIRKKEKRTKPQNIFIKCWNNEHYLNYVNKKTNKIVGNKLTNHFDIFCLFLLTNNDDKIINSYNSFINDKAFVKNENHFIPSKKSQKKKQKKKQKKIAYNHFGTNKIKNHFKCSTPQYTNIHSIVSINKRKKQKKKSIIFYKKNTNKMNKLANIAYDEMDRDSEHGESDSRNSEHGESDSRNSEHDESDSRNINYINKKSENAKATIDVSKFKTKDKQHNDTLLQQKNNLIKFRINYKHTETTYLNDNIQINNLNYFLYKNIFIPINNHFYMINKILVFSYLINKNLLIYLSLLKCLLFDESEHNYNFFKSIILSKENSLESGQNEVKNSLENGQNEAKNIYFSQKLSNTSSKIYIRHKFNTNFYKANLITNKFFNINIDIHIPQILYIFFDKDVINYYKNIYSLVSLFYYTINNLKDIFFIFRSFSKPVIYNYAEKVTHKLGDKNYQNGMGDKNDQNGMGDKNDQNGRGDKNIFANITFKYMDVIKKIANKHKDYIDENDDIENSFCVINKKYNNIFLTHYKILNVGFDKKLLNSSSGSSGKIIKYLENIKIFNEILNDFNKIRSEMLLIITYLYDYIININIYKNYFLCFQNMLKTDKFIQLIYIHKYFIQHIFKFSFLASHFFFFSKIIFNIINTIDQFKKLVTSLQLLDNFNSDQEHTFSFIFDKHYKIVEQNIILLTSEQAQKIIKNFYINRNNLVTDIAKFQNNNLDYIYSKFYFNDYYSSLFEHS